MRMRHEICDMRKHTQRSQFDVFSCGLLVIFKKTKFLNKANVHSVLSFDLYVSHLAIRAGVPLDNTSEALMLHWGVIVV